MRLLPPFTLVVTVLVVGLPVTAVGAPIRYDIIPIWGQDCKLDDGGTILTDGHIGQITEANIISIEFTTSSSLGTVGFTKSDLTHISGIYASEHYIYIPADAPGRIWGSRDDPHPDIQHARSEWEHQWWDPRYCYTYGNHVREIPFTEFEYNSYHGTYASLYIANNGRVIPEPGTIGLLLTGAAGMLVLAWRRQKRTT